MKVIVGGDLYDVDKDDVIILEITDELRDLVANAAPDATTLMFYNEDVLSEPEAEALIKNAKTLFKTT